MRDFAHASGSDTIDAEVADKALSRLEIDALGLDAMDRRYLTMIADLYGGGPVGVETLAAGLSEPRDTIEDVIEPFLIQLGLIARTARGRCLERPRLRPSWLAGAAGRPDGSVRRRSLAEIMRFLLIAAAALSTAAPLSSQTSAPAAAPDYGSDSTWLCLPGRKDVCSTPLPTTELNANGYGSKALSPVAKDPPIDCFYVYPTVSSDSGMNSDLNAGREEKLAAEAQFARFASVCRPFAPIYRQMTLGAVAAYSAGVEHRCRSECSPTRDVLAAWRNYLATRNQGRPFVLIGHSQGSLMLQMLIAARDRE